MNVAFAVHILSQSNIFINTNFTKISTQISSNFCSVGINNMPSKSLAELPAEVRNNIYEHVLPRGIDVRLRSAKNDGVVQEPLKVQMDTAEGVSPCAECMEFARSASALMQTCSKIHAEFAPRLYTMSAVVIVGLPVAARFVDNIPSQFQPLIKDLCLVAYDTTQSEKAAKLQMQSIAQGLTGLRHFEWRGVNRMADDEEKGTQWKPYELRKMLTLLKFSTHICKVFYNSFTCPWCTQVRFTDAQGAAVEGVSSHTHFCGLC